MRRGESAHSVHGLYTPVRVDRCGRRVGRLARAVASCSSCSWGPGRNERQPMGASGSPAGAARRRVAVRPRHTSPQRTVYSDLGCHASRPLATRSESPHRTGTRRTGSRPRVSSVCGVCIAPQNKRTPQTAATPPGRRRSAPVARGRRRSDSDDDSDAQGITPTATSRVQPQRAARKAQPIVDADPDAEQPPPPTMPCARAVMRGGPLMYVEAATQIWGPPGTPPPFGCPWTPAPRRRAATPCRRRSGVG